MKGKVIIVSAPSGCGKSTIIGRLMASGRYDMEFSVSATNRQPRQGETDGKDYHFLTTDAFRQAIADDAFVEYEEVYPGRFYGTLKSEVEKRRAEGHNVVLDIDVKGGVNVKKLFGDEALSIFIMPPSVDELKRRLEGRGTDTPEDIAKRVGKAEYEISFAPMYDCVVVNDNLDEAIEQVGGCISKFTGTDVG